MADKVTILQNAQRYMAKGQLDKAIDEWQKLISESPNDGNIYNTIGDLLMKKNDLPKAVEAYLKGAEVFHAAGFALKTIAIYKKLIKFVPERLDILIKLGDLNAERGLTGNAVEDYLTVAKQYTQDGLIKEALEVYRKIANLDPGNTSIRLKLAEMCLKEGLQQDAINEFLKVASSYQQNNRLEEAQALYQRVLKLDPNNEAVRKMTGMPEVPPEPPSKEQRLSQIDDSIEKGLHDESQKLLRQFIELHPDDPIGHCKLGMVLLKAGNKDEAFGSLKTAVQQYLNRNEYGQAGKLMKDYLETDPDRIEAHHFLAEAYDRGGNPHLAVSAYAHVIDEYLALGETVPARDLYNKIKTVEPQHRDVRRLRHTFEATELSQPQIIIQPQKSRLPETAAEPPPPPQAAQEVRAVPETAPTPIEPAAIVDPAALQSLFTEAEVYLKYGLSSKAIEQLRQILVLDPENEMAHQQLKDIYKNEGQTEKAVEECFHLMEIYKKMGETERRAAILEEARNLDPENPHIREATDLGPIMESGRMDAILAEEPVALETSRPSSEIDPIEPRVAAQEAAHAEISSDSLRERDREKDDIAEQMAEADFYHQEGLRDEAKKMYELILALQPDHAATREKLEAIGAEEVLEKEMKAKQVENVPISEPLSEPQKAPLTAREPKEPKPADLKFTDEQIVDEELERSFAPFMSSDAGESVEIAEEAGAGKGKESLPSGARKETDDELLNLSGMLDEELKEDHKESVLPDGQLEEETIDEQLDSIFSEFQKGAKEKAENVDYETHYNLGIAYKEMGLLNEAILEFKQAMKEPDRFIDACSMLAACQQESGNLQEAAALLERALSDSRCSEAQGCWLRYDLASLHEKEERLEEALALFNKIVQSDRNFKDAAQRVANLQKLLGKPLRKIQTSEAESDEDKDVDAMMEKIFGEASSATPAQSGKAGVPRGAKDEVKKKDRISYL